MERRKRILAIAALACVLSPAVVRADETVCQYRASPSVRLDFSTHSVPGLNTPAIVEHWNVGCTTTCDPRRTIKFWEGIRLVYDAERETELRGVNSLGPGSDTSVDRGDTVVDSPIVGVKIVPIFRAGCGDGVTGTDLIEAPAAPFVVPPYLPPPEQMNVMIDDPAFPSPLRVVPATQLPVGYRFHLRTLIGATPKGGELLVVRIEGAGISFEKAYGTSDRDLGEMLASDPDAQLLARNDDPIEILLSFEGALSARRILTPVRYGAADGGAADGGAAPARRPTRGRGARPTTRPPRMAIGTLESAWLAGPVLSLAALVYERKRRRARARPS